MPVYMQLKEMLRRQIEQGVYHTHQKLPSERTLCQHYNLSRMTARRALRALINDGLAYTRAGKGTFVGSKHNFPPVLSNLTDPSQHAKLARSLAHYFEPYLLRQLMTFNCYGVEQIIREALAVYSVETVAFRLFPAVIRQIEAQWLQGEISLMAQNFAVTTLKSHLISLFNASLAADLESPLGYAKVLLACAPQDQHEIGLLLVALSLRRRGFQVIYLGPHVDGAEFHHVIDAAQPTLVCFSAATIEAGRALIALGQRCVARLNPGVGLVFGGITFVANPGLITQVPGLYLGDTITAAVEKIEGLLFQQPFPA